MRHVIGLSSAGDNERRGWPLDSDDRIRFDSDDFRSLGYFHLLSSAFDHYAWRDAEIGITSINVMFRVRRSDFSSTLDILKRLEHEVLARPRSWREQVGTMQPPRSEPIKIEPLLYRGRALRIIHLLQVVVEKAMKQNKLVVYGNGVCYRALCGIKLPPDTVEYS